MCALGHVASKVCDIFSVTSSGELVLLKLYGPLVEIFMVKLFGGSFFIGINNRKSNKKFALYMVDIPIF